LGLQLIILSAIFIALSNLCLRRSIDSGGTSRAFLAIQRTCCLLFIILLHPVRTGEYFLTPSMAAFGLLAGIFLAGVSAFLGRALEHGPPGLTIALLNSSSVMPILFLVILFGSSFGFFYTTWNGLGSLFVVIGIYWAGWKNENQMENRKKWLGFALLSFFAHIFYLVFLNWRALFINFPQVPGLGFSFSSRAASTQWFLPMVFLSAALIQIFLFLPEKRVPKRPEMINGILGGVFSLSGIMLMVKATEVSTSFEHAMLFPTFSVVIIIACNLWGKWLYQERINWKANTLCIGGLVLGTVDWNTLLSLK